MEPKGQQHFGTENAPSILVKSKNLKFDFWRRIYEWGGARNRGVVTFAFLRQKNHKFWKKTAANFFFFLVVVSFNKLIILGAKKGTDNQ